MNTRCLAVLVVALLPLLLPAAVVKLQRVPEGGLQPQVVVDAAGAWHLIFLKGDAKACDVFYTRRDAGQADFPTPTRVNSQSGSAVAVGTIRGAQLAVGKKGLVHVAWNGSMAAEPKPAGGGMPMLYARLNDGRSGFEPQRNLMQSTTALDGGGSVAADDAGNVFVMWHATTPEKRDQKAGETARAVYLAKSGDEGRTFAPERAVNPQPTGACGCCGLRAFSDRRGAVFALYRSASTALDRDMTLLISRDAGAQFATSTLNRWQIGQCPMSSEAFTERAGRVYAAWETAGPVQFTTIEVASGQVATPVSAPTAAKGKHPALAVNSRGEVLLVWTEGTGWQKGGSLAWQVFSSAGQQQESGTRAGAVPVWGLPAAIALPDDSFAIFH